MMLFNTLSILVKQARFHPLYGGMSGTQTGEILVTNDYRCFKIFLQSPIAEESLHSMCAKTLGISQSEDGGRCESEDGGRSYKGNVRDIYEYWNSNRRISCGDFMQAP